jgi:hypothetical protein
MTDDTQTLIDSIEQQTPDDTTPLADDLDASIAALADQVDLSGSGASPIPISPEQGISILRPMIQTKTSKDPEATLRTLAILHLETGALLDRHSDLDPVELVK